MLERRETYYPVALVIEDARVVTLGPEQEMEGIDITLALYPNRLNDTAAMLTGR